MSRAAFLPTPGDPYVLLHTLWFFHHIWQDEVDRLYVHINSPIERPVAFALIDFMKNMNSKIRVSYSDSIITHGRAIDTMLAQCTEDHIMLIEDDSFIFKKGIVDEHFKLLETGQFDILGSPRGSCSQNWAELAKIKFNLNYTGQGDKGANFWPCFMWASKKCMEKTDRHFDSKTFPAGEVFLGHRLNELACADTFGWASIQFRLFNFKIKEIPQYHCHPSDLDYYKPRKLSLFDNKCGYMHTGSISSMLNGYLVDERNVPLNRRTDPTAQPELRDVSKDMVPGEAQNRLAWCREAFRVGKELGFYVPGFSEAYEKSLNYFQERAGFNNEDWQKWIRVYKGEVMKLPVSF